MWQYFMLILNNLKIEIFITCLFHGKCAYLSLWIWIHIRRIYATISITSNIFQIFWYLVVTINDTFWFETGPIKWIFFISTVDTDGPVCFVVCNLFVLLEVFVVLYQSSAFSMGINFQKSIEAQLSIIGNSVLVRHDNLSALHLVRHI